MNRSFLTIILTAGVAMSASAQDKIIPAGRMLLQEFKEAKAHPGEGNKWFTMSNPDDAEVPAIVALTGGVTADRLRDEGFTVTADLGDMAVITLPLARAEFLASKSWVRSMSFGQKATPMLDQARPTAGVDRVQNGFDHNGETISFDGSGVVCGMMDIGLEANHINFKNPDGTSRISRLWRISLDTSTGKVSQQEYTPENISSFSTDTRSESHATHVGGIIGGGYKGDGRYIYVPKPGNGSGWQDRDNSPIPYYGVATGADLAFNCGELYLASIIQGVSNVMDYAAETGKPAVVNLSLGHTTGPHDGTDNYCRALAALGQRGIICISAGNDGDTNMSLVKDFTSGTTGKRVMTTIKDNTAHGTVDIWSNDNQPLTVTIGIYDMKTGDKALLTVDAAGQSLSSASNPEFAASFSGSVRISSNIDVNNNRYNCYINFSNVEPKATASDRYITLKVEGNPGQTAYIYGSSTITFSKSGLKGGYVDGNPNNSINDGACAENVVSVGAYTSRNVWGQFNGVYQYSNLAAYPIGEISPFSSYGPTFQGKQLPLVCGPGANIVSSYSTYYVKDKGSEQTMTASAKSGNDTYYWGTMQGTSMSCPFVTGTIGLWLQACPELDFDKVMDVIDNTSVAQTQEPQRWGAGKINALEGIKYILQKYAANGAVWEDDDRRLVVSFNGSGYDVTMAGEAQFTVTVYDIQGRPVATARGLDGQTSVTTSELTPGVYVLAAHGASSRLTRKVTVR